MPYYTPLPDGTIVKDDQGRTFEILKRSEYDDDGTPVYEVKHVSGPKVHPRFKLLLSCFITEVVKISS